MDAYWFYEDLVKVHLSGEDTGGRYALMEWVQRPGEWTPLHVHRSADQTMFVLEGEITLYLPGSTVVAGPGEVAHGPKGVPHTEHITSAEPSRVMEMVVPAGFDRFIAAAGAPAAELTLPPADWPEPDMERLAQLAAEHGDLELLGAPGELP